MPEKLDQAEQALLDSLYSGASEREVCSRLGYSERDLQAAWQGIAAKLQDALPDSVEDHERLHVFETVERRRMESELWASEARLNALMDIAPEAIFVVNGRSGRILKMNNQASVLLGYTPRELIGKEVEILVSPDARAKHINLRNGFLNSVRKREMGFHPPISALKKDGSIIQLDIALTATAATDDVMVVCQPVHAEERTPQARRGQANN